MSSPTSAAHPGMSMVRSPLPLLCFSNTYTILLAQLEVHLLELARLIGNVGLCGVDGPVWVVLHLGGHALAAGVHGVKKLQNVVDRHLRTSNPEGVFGLTYTCVCVYLIYIYIIYIYTYTYIHTHTHTHIYPRDDALSG